MNKTNQKNGGNTGSMARRLMCATMGALAAMSLTASLEMRGCGQTRPAGNGTAASGVQSKVDRKSIRRQYEAAVAAALERYLDRVDRRTEAFGKGVRERGPARFDEARAAIPGIRKQFGKTSTLWGVVKDGALDKACGGDRLERRLAQAVEGPFFGPCARAAESLSADGEAFRAELDKEFGALCAELGEAARKWPEAVPAEFPSSAVLDGMLPAERALGGMPLKAAVVVAETAMDAAAYKSILSGLRWMVAKMAGKAIARGSVAAVAPACDGPLPVGDVIAVGFALWTLADIHELTHVLPSEIGKALENSVERTQAETLDAVEQAAQQTAEAYRAAGKALADKASAKRRWKK